MSSTPQVSVVVPVLNAVSTVGEMLRALAAQRFDRPWETIVVDGGSNDGTQALVARFPVTLVVEPKRGPAAARNNGLLLASGDLICHLDADTVPTRDWLRALVAPFEDPTVVVVGGKTVSLPSQTPAQSYMAASGRIDAVDYIHRPIFPFVPSRNMAVRREAALAIGGWANECITGEDVDFCHRLLARFPDSMRYAERAVVLHRNRASDDELRRQAWGYGEGVAHLYARYPGEVRWRRTDPLRVAGKLIGYSLAPIALSGAHRLGLANVGRVERAHYHRIWKWAFWRGFFSYRRTGSYA